LFVAGTPVPNGLASNCSTLEPLNVRNAGEAALRRSDAPGGQPNPFDVDISP
jgi:hypothetical protein